MIEKRFISKSFRDDIIFEIKSIKNADAFIWHQAFEDSLSEIENSTNKLKNSGFCASLVKNNIVLSQFVGLETNFKEKKGIYIYALCTNPAFRNKGYMRLLLELSFEYGKEVGYDFFWLFPASEDLKKSYNKIGFTVEIPVGASSFPTEENDFFSSVNFKNLSNGIVISAFDGDYKRLYCFSDKIFDYDTFEYSIKSIADNIEINYIEECGKVAGFIILSKIFPHKAIYVSDKYARLIKKEKKEFAYLYPLSFSNYNDIYSAEPLPR